MSKQSRAQKQDMARSECQKGHRYIQVQVCVQNRAIGKWECSLGVPWGHIKPLNVQLTVTERVLSIVLQSSLLYDLESLPRRQARDRESQTIPYLDETLLLFNALSS